MHKHRILSYDMYSRLERVGYTAYPVDCGSNFVEKVKALPWAMARSVVVGDVIFISPSVRDLILEILNTEVSE